MVADISEEKVGLPADADVIVVADPSYDEDRVRVEPQVDPRARGPDHVQLRPLRGDTGTEVPGLGVVAVGAAGADLARLVDPDDGAALGGLVGVAVVVAQSDLRSVRRVGRGHPACARRYPCTRRTASRLTSPQQCETAHRHKRRPVTSVRRAAPQSRCAADGASV